MEQGVVESNKGKPTALCLDEVLSYDGLAQHVVVLERSFLSSMRECMK